MRINGHAHIFNLQTVLTDETIAIMANRLRRMGLREYIVEAVEDILQDQLDHPEYLSEDELLVRFVAAIASSGAFAAAEELPLDIRTLRGSTGGLGVRSLQAVLDRLSEAIAVRDGPGSSPKDVFQTLRIAMQPDIPRVARKLLAHLEPDDAIVALLMDITSETEGSRDRINFRRQIQGTMDAVLAHPGRVLPFIAVNPLRDDHYEIMDRAIQQQGFLGVKLYPSLGYEMTTDKMRRVLEYCREHEVPITIHTSAGGFFRDAETAQYSHPKHWRELFIENDGIRVCFAHCGGWGGLCGQDPDQAAWTEQILTFIRDFDHVYADISYHVDQMLRGPDVEKAYFDALNKLIDGDLGDRIIFGTDSWLLRLNVDDAIYWQYFERNLGAARFKKIAEDVPRSFLGLPGNGVDAKPNAARHLAFLEEHAGEVGGVPAAWVREASSVSWNVVRRDAGWTLNNWAHRLTFSYLRDQIPGKVSDRDFPEAGPIRLRQLEYFRRHAGGPSSRIVEGKALELMAMCSRYGKPEIGHTDASILASLQETLADPNRTVAEVGAAVDALYLFTPEIIS